MNQSPSTFGSVSLRTIFVVTTVVAVALPLVPVTTVASKCIIGVIGLTFVFGCRKTRVAAASLVPVMYLPYLWLFWDWHDWPWDSYRRSWMAMLAQLPGLLAEIPLHPLSEPGFSVVTGMATLAVFFSFLLVARRGRWWMLASAVLLLVLSSLNSSICLALYRA